MTQRLTFLTVLGGALLLSTTSEADACSRRRHSQATCHTPSLAPNCDESSKLTYARQNYVMYFYEADGQYAGSSISTDPGALNRQCANWRSIDPRRSCRGPFPY